MTPSSSYRYVQRPLLTLMIVLLLSSLLSVGLYLLRVTFSGGLTYLFLLWNMVLAWLPVLAGLLSYFLTRHRRGQTLALPFLALWLLFFPNAPYIITDLLHLRDWGQVPLWFDALMLFSFAWNGLLLGLASLALVHRSVNRLLGNGAGWSLVLLSSGAAGFGVYLGRFQRWNSWDLLLSPQEVLVHALAILQRPAANPLALAVTLFFGVFLVLAYLGVLVLGQVAGSRAAVSE